jgi:carbon monoxide dehydrogenase subunit G
VAASPYVVEYRGTFDFSRAPEEVWEAIGHIERFEGWWWWLGQLRMEGPGLVPGAVLQGLVSPPVPYRMRVRVELDSCEEPTSIDATVGGDLVGPATLRLSSHGGGTRVDVAWSLEMKQRPMRLAARVAKPLLQWGHDRVVEATVSALASDLGYVGGGGRHLP